MYSEQALFFYKKVKYKNATEGGEQQYRAKRMNWICKKNSLATNVAVTQFTQKMNVVGWIMERTVRK